MLVASYVEDISANVVDFGGISEFLGLFFRLLYFLLVESICFLEVILIESVSEGQCLVRRYFFASGF